MQRVKGLVDPAAERFSIEARRPIAEHLKEYQSALQARGNDTEYVGQTAARVEFIVSKCKAERIGELTASDVQAAIGRLRDTRSAGTCNSYLRSIKGFTRWAWRDKRTRDDALSTLSGLNEAADRQRVRRELSADELSRLITAAEQRTLPQHTISGADRAMVYRLAAGTGFRAKELRSLTPESFDLDAEPPTVTVAAAHSKRRHQDVQPIRRDLAEVLRPWLAGKLERRPVFDGLPDDTARMLRKDLDAARADWINEAKNDQCEFASRQESDFLAYKNATGEVADFHSIRHTYISGIVASGASVKVAQTLARHSTPTLTIGRYAHARLHDLQGALDGLPDQSPTNEPRVLRATGTDNAQPSTGSDKKWAHFGAQLGGESGQNVARSGEPGKFVGAVDAEKSTDVDRCKVLSLSALGDNTTASGEMRREAEGTGLEPATGCPAPHFQCGR